MSGFRSVDLWPLPWFPDGTWGSDAGLDTRVAPDPPIEPAVDALKRVSRAVCELYSEALRPLGLQAKSSRVELFCRQEPSVDDRVEVVVWLDPLMESELTRVDLPAAVAGFSVDELASLALAIVDGAMRRLADARGWPQSAMDSARDHVLGSGFRFVWHGDWKANRNRQLRARLRVELLDTGFGELTIQVAGANSVALIAESPPHNAYATVEGFRRSGRTLRWIADDELEVSPYCGPRGVYDDRKVEYRVGPGGSVHRERVSPPRRFVEPAIPVRIVGRGPQAAEQAAEVQLSHVGRTKGVPQSYVDEMVRLAEELRTPRWQSWWSKAPHAVLEIDVNFRPRQPGPAARVGKNFVRASINRWPKTIDQAHGMLEARSDLDELLEKLRLRYGLDPLPSLN